MSTIGKTLAHYEIIGHLGKGGMGGCVYDKGCSAFGKLKLRSILRSGIVLTIFGLLVMPVGLVTGQQIISAQSGIIDHLQGNVSLDGAKQQLCGGCFIQMENGQCLRTEGGRVEMLLTPYATLWLDEYSSLRMDYNELNDTRVKLEKGSALIEILQKAKKNRIRVQIAESVAEIEKEGVYRFDAGLHVLRVYKGRASALMGNSKNVLKNGRMTDFSDNSESARFDRKTADPLHQWAANRSLELFMRNNETRKQTHWKYLGADFLWNEGFQVMLRSMDYAYIILEERKRTVEEENKIRRQLPCVPRYGDSCIAP
jgi:hypothetical protein